ncbi:MAG: patatin-like phospholipase family protein [Trueperaceae bacterium]|jgi:NTE family protein|nr:patatin-like phospholipase family protein [Truepera sp.]
MERPGRHISVGLVLSGGGARGFAHIGVLRALERAGAKFDVVAGTSMGAILGAIYARGASADDLYELAKHTAWRDVVDLSLKTALLKGDRLGAFLAEVLPATFEELELPLAVVATDIESGEEVVMSDGDLVSAVRASASFPGAFEPVHVGGRTLADGGIVNNLPVNAAGWLGANRVIASDVTPPRKSVYLSPDEDDSSWWERMVATVKLERRNPMAQMLFRSSDIQQAILVDINASIHPADLRIRMAMPHFRVESFLSFEEIVLEGERAAEAALEAAGGWPAVLEAYTRDRSARARSQAQGVDEESGAPADSKARFDSGVTVMKSTLARVVGRGAKKS